ncbi:MULTISPECIES: RluA family pseudouridine synthase [Bordetella]|uniref:RluA family pseudouridine synthase n=1 Tax=Bordetella TaxID=517 RepID=UPI00045A37BA|nr:MULTISPECIES: RluA family pseudouridine synthase [Bordetella]ARP75748.1 RNA pseudouridine synthase [Bordetella genomosp. 6]AZW45231.1 RluA family pseudouridine synthase [Bordetella bronchiseptica]KCV64272.1 pseudouridine synthase, RluA family [Bordetella bronchiseptica 99-R-0433]MBN3266182.1 RluA family pseudouridine synthase [Bordetella bronchiseptica]
MSLSAMRKETSPGTTPPAVRMLAIGPEHDGQRIDNFLLRLCKGVPKSHIYKAIRGGEVRVNKGRISAEYRLVEGDVVRVPPLRLPDPGAARPVPGAEFPVVHEDDALLVIDKPAGVAVHGGSGVSFGVIEQLRAARPQARFLELVHRLDRETSGLLMVAKKRSALLALHAMLREGKGDKHYLALVEGDWVNDRQHIRLPLTKWTTQSGERRVRVDQAGQAAHTIVTLRKRFGGYSLVDAELRTGRTHQIRVHLASSGFPIVGDDKYGTDETRAAFARRGFGRMFLHAHQLTLPHPLTGETLRLTADLPPACLKLLKQLETA